MKTLATFIYSLIGFFIAIIGPTFILFALIIAIGGHSINAASSQQPKKETLKRSANYSPFSDSSSIPKDTTNWSEVNDIPEFQKHHDEAFLEGINEIQTIPIDEQSTQTQGSSDLPLTASRPVKQKKSNAKQYKDLITRLERNLKKRQSTWDRIDRDFIVSFKSVANYEAFYDNFYSLYTQKEGIQETDFSANFSTQIPTSFSDRSGRKKAEKIAEVFVLAITDFESRIKIKLSQYPTTASATIIGNKKTYEKVAAILRTAKINFTINHQESDKPNLVFNIAAKGIFENESERWISIEQKLSKEIRYYKSKLRKEQQ